MNIETLQLFRSVIAKVLAIGGLLLTSAGILGNPRLESIERINRKIRKRVKFSVFFYSSRPLVGKFYILYLIIGFAATAFIALFSPDARQNLFTGHLLSDINSIIGIIGFAITLLIPIGVISQIIKNKSPKDAYLEIHDKVYEKLPELFTQVEIPKLRVYDRPISLLLFPLDLIILYSAFLFWVSISLSSLVISLTLTILLFPYKTFEAFRVKTKLRGGMVTAGVLISMVGILLD